MVLEEIDFDKIWAKPENIYVKLKEGFLVDILKKASKIDKPHRDKEFCKKLGVSFNKKIKASPTIIAWIRLNKSIPLSKLLIIKQYSKISWSEVEENIINLRSGFSGGRTSINFPIKLNISFGSVVGHILGDGSIDKKYKQVFYSNSNKELLEEFSKDMEKIFNIKPRIWMQRTSNFEGKTRWDKRINNINELKKERNGGLFYPSICGVLLNIILDDFAIGKNKKITKNMINCSKEFKVGLLRAFYDDEGNVKKDGLRLFQDRKDILENMRNFLLELRISPGEIKTYVKRDKERYYFDIYRKSNLIQFRDVIGFTSSKKMDKLKEVCIIKRPNMIK